MKETAVPRPDSWKARLKAFRDDRTAVERYSEQDQERRRVIPSMRRSLEAFLSGVKTVEEFKVEFDRRTRTEWDVFGFKGASGAMFLNKLVIHIPDQAQLAQELRRVLPVAADESTAREHLAGFQAYLEGRIEAGTVDRAQIQPSRGPFFVSGWWHVQEPESWPPYYASAKGVLELHGGFRKSGDLVEDYFEFLRLYIDRARKLGLSLWEFEHLCAWLDRPEVVAPPVGPVEPPPKRVWLFAPGAKAAEWESMYAEGIAAIEWDYLGNLREYAGLEGIRAAISEHREPGGKAPINAGLACYQFAHEMQPGDQILAKKGKREIVGVGTVASDYRYEPARPSYHSVRKVEWSKKGSWMVPRDLVTKTLTDIGKYPQLLDDVRAAIDEGGNGPTTSNGRAYEIDDAEPELFLERTEIEDLLALLRGRKNLILQGPPGTGKSYLARRLAWLATGEKDSDRLASVQFHQSYGYEDFVQGYRPSEGGGFRRVDGPFLRFCTQALQDQASDYVLLIDEINRGNLSRIFGELMLLIEPDKRSAEWAVALAYSTDEDRPFHVPPNLLIIGTMNTADRSLALVDYALRRRFAFFDLEPAFLRPKFDEHLSQLGVEKSLRERILERLQSLNQQIRKDPDLGPGYRIGHSYFCNTDEEKPCDEAWFVQLVETEIAPLLREYWPEDEDRARNATEALLEEG